MCKSFLWRAQNNSNFDNIRHSVVVLLFLVLTGIAFFVICAILLFVREAEFTALVILTCMQHPSRSMLFTVVSMKWGGSTLHSAVSTRLETKKKSHSGQLPLVGLLVVVGQFFFYNLCYLDQLWYSSKLVERRPSTGKSQVGRLVRPSCTISVTLLGT